MDPVDEDPRKDRFLSCLNHIKDAHKKLTRSRPAVDNKESRAESFANVANKAVRSPIFGARSITEAKALMSA